MNTKIVVIGAGPGGYVAALRAAQMGADVTVVENDRVGGTCLNWGCIPSKVMKSTADLLCRIKRSAEFGVLVTGEVTFAPDKLSQRRAQVIDAQAKGIHALFNRRRIVYRNGFASLSGDHKILVRMVDGAREEISWDRLIVASGSRPAAIPSIPLDGQRIISSNEALHLERIPKSIIIVGGGVIGCEFAFIFSAFGSSVTVVEARDRLLPLPSVDEDCSKTLMREMKKRKIAFYLNATVDHAEFEAEKVRLHLSDFPPGDGSAAPARLPGFLEAEQVLVCIGRRPNTDQMGLRRAGVAIDENGWLRSNMRMETNVSGIYALGDVLGPERVMLAHVASMEGLIAAENAMGGKREMNYDTVPGAVFTTPEVAHAGLTETQARQRFDHIRADTVLFRTIGKAQVIGEPAGMAKLVSDARSGRILGVHLVGAHATDLIAEGVLAIAQGVTVEGLARTIHAHPTLAEVMYEAALAATDRPLHG